MQPSRSRCTQRFGDVASARDTEAGRNPPFDMPYAVDGDKVSCSCWNHPAFGCQPAFSQRTRLPAVPLLQACILKQLASAGG